MLISYALHESFRALFREGNLIFTMGHLAQLKRRFPKASKCVLGKPSGKIRAQNIVHEDRQPLTMDLLIRQIMYHGPFTYDAAQCTDPINTWPQSILVQGSKPRSHTEQRVCWPGVCDLIGCVRRARRSMRPARNSAFSSAANTVI